MSQIRYTCLIYSNKPNEWHWQLTADNGIPMARNVKPLASKASAKASVKALFNVTETTTVFPQI